MLRHSLGGAVIFISLEHFIALVLDVMPCLPSWKRREAIKALNPRMEQSSAANVVCWCKLNNTWDCEEHLCHQFLQYASFHSHLIPYPTLTSMFFVESSLTRKSQMRKSISRFYQSRLFALYFLIRNFLIRDFLILPYMSWKGPVVGNGMLDFVEDIFVGVRSH